MRAGQTRLRALFASHQQLRRIDDTLGLNLPRLFGQLGLVQTEMAFIYPVYLHGSGSVYEYSFFEANPYFIGSGLADAAELKRVAELTAVTADETISVAQARMPAAWAQALVILGKATHRMGGA
jgi:hypothetical protein